MGYYEKTVEQLLKEKVKELKDEEYQNVLMQFDNWTYHIRLSVLPKKSYEEYIELKEKLLKNENTKNKMIQIIESESVVITETGVISNPFIESLNMKSFFSIDDTVTTNLVMKIIDTQGIGLVNKINALTMALGYGSNFVNQPFFITVWFTGYNGTNIMDTNKGETQIGMPQKVIPVYTQKANQNSKSENQNKLYYEVVATKVDSDVSTYKATWTFTFTVCDSSLLIPKDNIFLTDIGELVVPKGKPYITTLASDAVNKISTKIRKKLGDTVYNILYNKKGTATNNSGFPNSIDIKFYNPDGTLYYSTDLSDKNKDGFDGIHPNVKGDTFIDYVKDYDRDLSVKFSEQDDLLNIFKNLVIENKTQKVIQSMSLNNAFMTGNTLAGTQQANMGIVPRTSFDNIYVGEYNGDSYYKTILNVFFENRDDMKQMMYDEKDFINKIVETQKKIVENSKFVRLYEWMTGNNENYLLDYKAKMNNLWFLNTGLSALESARVNTPCAANNRTLTKEANKQPQKTQTTKQNNELNDNLLQIPKMKTMDDYWDYIMKNSLIDTLIMNSFTMRDDNLSSDDIKTSTSESPQDNVNKTRSRIGYQNLIDSGNATSIELNIIGDPMWLNIGSILSPKDKQEYITMNVIFKRNGYFQMDDHDVYKKEPLTQTIIPYIITQVDTDFYNGSFKQTLKGCVNSAFLIDNYQIKAMKEEN